LVARKVGGSVHEACRDLFERRVMMARWGDYLDCGMSAGAAKQRDNDAAAILILAGSAAFVMVRLIESGWMWTVSNW
jgi:hypothetical protein